jgi:hypothetical protein
MNCCIVVKVSRRSVAFWYQADGLRYSPLQMKGVGEVPLYFYVRDNQFEFGAQARDRFYQNDPDAYGDYFSLIGDPSRHFMLHDSPKRIKQLLYYGIEQYLSHFLNTILYKSDSIEAYRAALPLKFVFAPDLGEPEKMLVADMFREAGYRIVSVLGYSNILLEQLRGDGTINPNKAALILSGLDDTLYLELYDSGIDQPLKIIAIPNQGADPRIRILAGMILNYILDQQPYLDLNTARELSALLPYCTVLLQNPPVILTGEAELTTGDKCWFRINLSKVEDSLRYYSGDLAATTIISDLLQRSNLAPDDVVVLLATEQIQTPYFSERLLKQYRHVQRIMPLHHDGAMELVFRKTVQRTETINNKTAQINPTIQRNPITAANPVIPNNPTTTTSARQAMPERPKMPPPLPQKPAPGPPKLPPPIPAAKAQTGQAGQQQQPPHQPPAPPPMPPFKKKN